VSTTRRLDVGVRQVVDRVVVKVNLEQLCDPLSREPLLLTMNINLIASLSASTYTVA
jgi:hypothetical protein